MSSLISIIVPVYNIERYVDRCLESICRQTHTNLEIIVVDDGSTDTTGELVERYAKKDSRVVVVHKCNEGVFRARLEGVRHATGEYVGFVDGDDVIELDMYERLLSNAKVYNAEISHCGYQMQFLDGRIHYFHNTGFLSKQDRVTALRELLSGKIVEPSLCNKLFQKSLLDNLLENRQIVVADISINEDLLTNFYLFSLAETCVFEDWCPYHYMVRQGSASRDSINVNHIYDPIKVKDIILSLATDEILIDAMRAYIDTCINVYHMLLLSGRKYRKDLKQVRKLVIKEKTSFSIMGRKRSLIARLIVYAPFFHKVVYSLYCKHFQINDYS